MSCTQLVTPNLDPYIVQPNGNGGIYTLTDWYKWCLAYVQFSFASGWAGRTAWDCWTNHTINPHEDRNIPGGMYVPIFFSGAGGDGHASIYKDGHVWSSPISHKPYADDWSSIEEVERNYHVTYVGWAEGLGGTQVVEYTPDAVAEPTTPQPTYQLTETYPTGKQIQLNKQPTNLWGMNYHFDYMVDHPVEVHNQGEIWTVTNKVHHENGYDYYRREDQVDGFNVLDCDDYTSPPPPVPYVPPAAPEVALPAQTYTLVTTVMTFDTQQDAYFRQNAKGTMPAGKYYIFDDVDTTLYIGKDNQHPLYWINKKDNKLPVVVPPVAKPPLPPSQIKVGQADNTKWMGSYKSFHPNRSSDLYEVKQHLTMLDYSGKRNPVALQPGDKVNVPGTFLKDGVMFYRTRSARDEFFSWYYGIPLYDDYGNIQVVKVVDTNPDRIERHLSDFVHYWKDDFKTIGTLLWDVVFKKNR